MKSRRMNRRANLRMSRKTKTRKARKMYGGNTPSETYRSPLFVNLTNKYGLDIMQGSALTR